MDLLLSLFPGIDLLGHGFEEEGACVVRGPDPALGTGDIRRFHIPPRKFKGIFGGSPCQDFSAVRRAPPTGYSLAMIDEFMRLVREGEPLWWLLENVPTVPDVRIQGYTHQRIDLRACEFGSEQSRIRHFQFGHAKNKVLIVERPATTRPKERCCLASEGTKVNRRAFARFCELQGLPADFELPYFTVQARYRAVGNGVPILMARAMAAAIRDHLYPADAVTVCACSCGRRVTGKLKSASMACRQRLSRRLRRDGAAKRPHR